MRTLKLLKYLFKRRRRANSKEEKTPLWFVARAGGVILFAILFGLIMPGLIAYYNGVFYDRNVEDKIQQIEGLEDVARNIENFKKQNAAIQDSINKLDEHLLRISANPLEQQNLSEVLELRKFLAAELKSRKAPVAASGFYLSNTMILWSALYLCLGWLVFVVPPPVKARRGAEFALKFLGLFVGVVLFYRFPIWMRNFLFYKEGRVYYGSANYDVDAWGFFAQECLGLMVAILLTTLWLKWSIYYTELRDELNAEEVRSPLEDAFDYRKIERLSTTFMHWQVNSIILAVGFIWYTYFFWDIILRTGDQRYVVNALIIHILWFVSWILMSLPLIIVWYKWQEVKTQALSEVVNSPPAHGDDLEAIVQALRDLQPIGYWNLAASSVGVVFSLVYPVLQAVLK